MRRLVSISLVALASCSLVQQRAGGGPVSGRSAGEQGMLQYDVGRLTFLAPDAWQARGDARRITVVHPEEIGRIEIQHVEKPFVDQKTCLEDAEQVLKRGEARLTNVRRHASSFAGRKAVTQEADQAGWHGQAWAVCDGSEQYRVFFTGRSPWTPDVKAAWLSFTKSAALGEGGGRT